MKTHKQEPIIWTAEVGELHEFLIVSKTLGLELIIYVQDSAGENKSIWATSKDDLMECLFTFSDKCYFGRIQNIDDAIHYGFYDEGKTFKR